MMHKCPYCGERIKELLKENEEHRCPKCNGLIATNDISAKKFLNGEW